VGEAQPAVLEVRRGFAVGGEAVRFGAEAGKSGGLGQCVTGCERADAASGYTQAALAELMRTRAIDLANQSAAAKLATTNNTNNNGLITGALTTR
jgi:hypothetical protein